MHYFDPIYGEFEITESILTELIKSEPLQRLKEIDQNGYFQVHFPNTAHSRFEHSLGVFLLLKKYNAPLEEQISGLLHDVSHAVFSHCIDYALNKGTEKEQNHQDNIHDEFIKKSVLPKILRKFGFDLNYILDDSNFPLKEKSLPFLCADRIDYVLRDAFYFKEINLDEIRNILNNLQALDGFWVFKNFPSAKKFADLFFLMNSKYYAGLPSAIMHRAVGDCLKYALEKNYLAEEDLYTIEKTVLKKIENFLNKDKELSRLFERMNNKIKAAHNPKDFDAHIITKSRAVDPLFEENGETKKVSDEDKTWKKILEEESKPKEYFLKFEK